MRYIKYILIIAFVVALLSITVSAARYRNKKYEFTVPDTSLVEINTNRYTHVDSDGEKISNRLDLEGFQKEMENEILEIWFNEKLATLRIVDKRSGYIWGFVGSEKPDNLNKSWYAMANSILTIDYYDKKDAEKRISLSSKDVEKQYKWKDNSLECQVNIPNLSIEFSFTMNLSGDGITFSLPINSLKESGKEKIKSVYFVPFLGTTQEDEIDGYMFVPDGPGALVRFSKAQSFTSGFSKKVYGLDMGIDTLESPSGLMSSRSDDYLVDEPQITVPVFGMVHGAYQNAYMAVIEDADDYATILANVSGIQTNYNWLTARYDYRQSYMHTVTKSGTGIYTSQENYNQISPKVTYHFLTGEDAGYAGMAVRYREILKESGFIKTERIDEEIPLRLNIIGAEIKKGFLKDYLTAFTNTDKATAIIRRLEESSINNLTLVYEGWQKKGINGSKYGEVRFESKVGRKKDFDNLKRKVEENGGRYYLAINPVTANEDQINKAAYASVNISKTYSKFTRTDKTLMYQESFLIKPLVITDYISKSRQKLASYNLAMKGLGMRLYSDYSEDILTRSDTKDLILQELKKSTDQNIAMYNPNQYLWIDTAEYFDIPIINSQYLYETDTVPFLQIVLKGSIDYYAPYANQGFYTQNCILKMIEYGAYPSFITAAADNYELEDTPLVDLYSVNFNDWYDTILQVYNQVNEALKYVEGAYITDHRVISQGIVRVSYSNGINIYLNYNQENKKVEGVLIPAKGCYIESSND